nr:PREDICTED: sialidase-4-like [Latimeria chalumnae]|eukprot:XP_006013993.1 PREDICTED: sialidase-4-like [Latimeria chalumnae]
MGTQYFPARTTLYKKQSNGVTYRVPALLYVPSTCTLLAFAEERFSPDDSLAHLLVLCRGTFNRSYVEWEDMRALQSARLKYHRSMNPCPVYDESTATIFLFFIAVLGNTTESYQLITGKNAARLCYITSTDQGSNWSEVTDLTEKVIGQSIKGRVTLPLIYLTDISWTTQNAEGQNPLVYMTMTSEHREYAITEDYICLHCVAVYHISQ